MTRSSRRRSGGRSVERPSRCRARWNERYAAEGWLFGTEPNDSLAARADCFAPGDRVLCVADGEGRNSTWLAARGCTVTAFDLSRSRSRRRARSPPSAASRSICGCRPSTTGYGPPGEAYDAVVAVFVQFATPVQRAAMFEGFARALRPGGLLLLVGYGPLQLDYRTGGPGIAEHLYTEPMLRERSPAGASSNLRAAQRVLHEGAGHAGPVRRARARRRRP
jgi:SAM-dependent methyltransferase